MLAMILVALIAGLHVYILILEMFVWQAPRTRAAFGVSAELAAQTKVMAANQGLYNGFLAAGLLWSLWLGLSGAGHAVALFFLICVLLAGLFGAATASRRILWVQAVPAVLTIIVVLMGW